MGGKRDIDEKPPLKVPTSDQIIKFAGKSYEKARMKAKVLAAKGARFVEPPFARKLRKLEHERIINNRRKSYIIIEYPHKCTFTNHISYIDYYIYL